MARGYRAVDTDSDEWCEWVTLPGEPPELDWIWRADRMRRLLETAGPEPLFVSGCTSNQGQFYPLFEHIVLLSAPVDVIIARLAARTNNPYGKRPEELADVLGYLETVEPHLRRGATLEIDTTAPLEHVVERILRHVLS